MSTSLVPKRLIASLPDKPNARLPETYRAAVNALEKCVRVDECKEWKNKATALASYARQAKNEEMLATAVRIQTRAITRAGELLTEIEPATGGQPFHSTRAGGGPSRKSAAEAAGFTDHQRKDALSMAKLKGEDPEKFEAAIESPMPPSPTAMLKAMRHRKKDITQAEFRAATVYLGSVKRLVKVCKGNKIEEILDGLGEHEYKKTKVTTEEALQSLTTIKRELICLLNSLQPRSERSSKKK